MLKRNWVAKNDFNRAATHKDKRISSRKNYSAWDEDFEPPLDIFSKISNEGSTQKYKEAVCFQNSQALEPIKIAR